MQREYDIIIWGASGFTGKIVCDYMGQNYGGGNLTWAIGGRNKTKLDALNLGPDVNVLVADAHDSTALAELVKKTRVVLTTVGPYARYGSELVEACANNGTHYCDLTGEVHWMRRMIEAHDAAAKESGARIVHTCGFDSIPSDIGVYFMQKKMQELHGVVANHVKYRTRAFKGGFSGGTVDSMMAMMEAAKSDPAIMDIVSDPYALNFAHRGLDGMDNNGQFYDEDFKAWIGPFVMAAINTRVVRRSNELLGQAYGSDFRYDEGSIVGDSVGAMFGSAAMAMGTSLMNSLAAIEPTRKLMQMVLPKPGEGPSAQTIEAGFFDIELLAKHPTDANKNLRGKVHGDRDPGYGSTAKMLSECAVALAQDELPVGGGFWTPASAMGDALLERLPANAGVTFELMD
jgi:short subunit dehydrogenase-like uncharacterized protein